MDERRRCPWCRTPLPAGGSWNRVFCSKSCRDAAGRARRANGTLRRKRCARCRRQLPAKVYRYGGFFCSRVCRSATDLGTHRYQIPPTDFTRAGFAYDPVTKRTTRIPAVIHACPLCARRGFGSGVPRREEDGVWVCDAIQREGRPCLWVWSAWADASKKKEEEPMTALSVSAAGPLLG